MRGLCKDEDESIDRRMREDLITHREIVGCESSIVMH